MFKYPMPCTLRRASRAAWPNVALAFALTACAPLPPVASHAAAPSAIHRAGGPLPVPPGLIALTQPAGQKRLISAAGNQSYWPLSEYFETQRNEAYCSVATSVMALNALGISRPESTQYPDFPYFSQEDFFRGVDPQVANAARVAKEGMTLDQLSAVLRKFSVNVEKFHSADLTLAQFRDLIRDTTGRSDRFALLNFRRVEIGQVGGGHWSPIAAFDVASDSALVLDVARYKYPAVWVPIAKLYAGSQAVDSVSGVSRGIVTISKR
jgi:hypothetical protein